MFGSIRGLESLALRFVSPTGFGEFCDSDFLDGILGSFDGETDAEAGREADGDADGDGLGRGFARGLLQLLSFSS